MDTKRSNTPNAASTNPATTEGLQFTELLQIVLLRRKLIYLLVVMSVLGVVVRQALYIPQFSSGTMLNVQKVENNPMQLALANLGTMPMDTSDRLRKYVAYLQSYDFYLAVAETLKFKEGYHLLNLTSPSDLTPTKKRFWKHFIDHSFGRAASEGDSSRPEGAPEPVLVPVESLAAILRNVTVATPWAGDQINITVTTLDPFTSMVLVNTISEVFIKKTSERDYNEVAEVKAFIQQQLENTTERLKRSESSMVEFKKKHNIVFINNEHNSYSTKLSGVESDLEQLKIKFEENRRLIAYYENLLTKRDKQLTAPPAKGARPAGGDLISRLRQQLDTLQYKKVLMQSQGYEEGSWQMAELNRDIEKYSALLKTRIENPGAGSDGEDDMSTTSESARVKLTSLRAENKALEVKISALDSSRESLAKNLGSLSQDEQLLLTLRRDVDLQFELYSSLKKKLQEIEIQQVALQSRISISERAGMGSPAPRTGLPVKVMFAILVSVFLGSFLSFLIEALDPTVKHLTDLERMEMIALGSIPRIEGSAVRSTLGLHTYRPDLLVCKEKPESAEAMAFKHIRAQLARMRGSDGQASKVICITSPERGDGKSFIASNLAVSLAQLEQRTLLIDADFRNPSVPWMFGYKEGPGLSSLLTLTATLDDVLLKDRQPFLDILPAGWSPSNPTELLSNEKFRVLLDHLRSQYAHIVIDCPPAIALVDAAVMASQADTVLMVAGFRRTKKPAALQALRRILQITNKHVHTILNGVSERQEYTASPMSTPLAAQGGAPEAEDAKAELAKFQEALRRKRVG